MNFQANLCGFNILPSNTVGTCNINIKLVRLNFFVSSVKYINYPVHRYVTKYRRNNLPITMLYIRNVYRFFNARMLRYLLFL